MLPPPAPPDPAARRRSLREGLGLWALALAALWVGGHVLGPALPWVADNLKAVAVLVFLYVPGLVMDRRGERFADYGLHLRHWRRDLAWGLGASVVVLGIFSLAFWGFAEALGHLPAPWSERLTPYRSGYDPGFRLPPDLAWLALTHLFVVALPEEFFYRGYLYARLCEALDERRRGRRVLGVVVGPAFWWTAVLFALGHLTEPHVWRLAVFFPALIFGWLRLRTGSLGAAIVFHALSNVGIAILEASFFPR